MLSCIWTTSNKSERLMHLVGWFIWMLYTKWIVKILVDSIGVLWRTFHFCFTLLLKSCVKNLFHLRDSVFTLRSLVPSPLLLRRSFPRSLCALPKYQQMPVFQKLLRRMQYYWEFQQFEQLGSFVVLLQNYNNIRFLDFDLSEVNLQSLAVNS
jgi:hypothetical protein